MYQTLKINCFTTELWTLSICVTLLSVIRKIHDKYINKHLHFNTKPILKFCKKVDRLHFTSLVTKILWWLCICKHFLCDEWALWRIICGATHTFVCASWCKFTASNRWHFGLGFYSRWRERHFSLCVGILLASRAAACRVSSIFIVFIMLLTLFSIWRTNRINWINEWAIWITWCAVLGFYPSFKDLSRSYRHVNLSKHLATLPMQKLGWA